MTKILVTGVAGLLGSNFVEYLFHEHGGNVDIIGIDDLSGGLIENIHPKLKFYKMNLCDQEAVQTIFKNHKPDYVYHFAAMAAEGLSPFIKNYTYQNNIISSANVINACIVHDVKKLIYTSSMATYGKQKTPFTEDMTPMPVDSYGIAKYAVEMELQHSHEFFGLNYSIVKPHNIIGKGQCFFDPYRNVIAIWMNNIFNNRPITIYGDGTQVRAFSDVKYYMKPFEQLMTVGDSEIYNLGADKDYTILEAASATKSVAESLGYKPTIIHLEARNEVHTAYCDHTKAKKELNFVDNTNLEDTIKSMFLWGQTIKQAPLKYVEYEIEKGIYSFWQNKK